MKRKCPVREGENIEYAGLKTIGQDMDVCKCLDCEYEGNCNEFQVIENE